MNYDFGACKNCANIAGITKDHKCTACGAERETVPLYTWFHQDYDLTEDPETVDKMDEMDNTEIKAAAVSGAEMKAGLRDLFICFGIAVVLVLIGFLFIKGAGGPVKGRMSFIGLLSWIAAPVMVILGICLFFKRVFSSARAKDPEKAFNLFWEAVFETKTFSSKYENVEIALNKITRSLPGAVRQSMDAVKTLSWISDLRNRIAQTNGELAQDCFRAYKDQIQDAKGDADSMTIQNKTVETVDEHKTVISADLAVARKWMRTVQRGSNSDTYSYMVSAGILHVKTTLLKAGKYWYVPDWMPQITEGERVDALREADRKNDVQEGPGI